MNRKCDSVRPHGRFPKRLHAPNAQCRIRRRNRCAAAHHGRVQGMFHYATIPGSVKPRPPIPSRHSPPRQPPAQITSAQTAPSQTTRRSARATCTSSPAGRTIVARGFSPWSPPALIDVLLAESAPPRRPNRPAHPSIRSSLLAIQTSIADSPLNSQKHPRHRRRQERRQRPARHRPQSQRREVRTPLRCDARQPPDLDRDRREVREPA